MKSAGAYLTIQNAIKYRVVSACMRFRYTGSNTTSQGTRSGAFCPTMLTKDGTYSKADIERQPISSVDRIDKEFRVIWIPSDPNDLNFKLLAPLQSSNLAIVFAGCEPGTVIGVVEVYTNLEYIPDEGYQNIVSQGRSEEPTTVVDSMDRALTRNPNLMT